MEGQGAGNQLRISRVVVDHFVGEQNGIPLVTAVNPTDKNHLGGTVTKLVIEDGSSLHRMSDGGNCWGDHGRFRQRAGWS